MKNLEIKKEWQNRKIENKVCHEAAENYPGIQADDWYIDIITDEAAEIQGGVGTAGSANMGDQYAMFEAIHGSAPRMIEDVLGDYANPSSIFKAAEMMIRHIGFIEKADKLAAVLEECSETEKKVVVTGFADGATCRAFADYVISKL